MVFSWFFRLAQARNFGEKNHGKNPGTRKFDAKHSANDDNTMNTRIASLIN